MRADGLVLRARLRQYWKSWLVLSALVALVGGLVSFGDHTLTITSTEAA
jgi:hypothetical protein